MMFGLWDPNPSCRPSNWWNLVSGFPSVNIQWDTPMWDPRGFKILDLKSYLVLLEHKQKQVSFFNNLTWLVIMQFLNLVLENGENCLDNSNWLGHYDFLKFCNYKSIFLVWWRKLYFSVKPVFPVSCHSKDIYTAERVQFGDCVSKACWKLVRMWGSHSLTGSRKLCQTALKILGTTPFKLGILWFSNHVCDLDESFCDSHLSSSTSSKFILEVKTMEKGDKFKLTMFVFAAFTIVLFACVQKALWAHVCTCKEFQTQGSS